MCRFNFSPARHNNGPLAAPSVPMTTLMVTDRMQALKREYSRALLCSSFAPTWEPPIGCAPKWWNDRNVDEDDQQVCGGRNLVAGTFRRGCEGASSVSGSFFLFLVVFRKASSQGSRIQRTDELDRRVGHADIRDPGILHRQRWTFTSV